MFMIGGDEKVVEQIKDVFDAMGKSAIVIGPNGAGSVTKLANQIMVNLKNVMETAKNLDVPLVMTGTLQQIMLSLKTSGHIMDDHSGIVQFYENISGVEVKTKS